MFGAFRPIIGAGQKKLMIKDREFIVHEPISAFAFTFAFDELDFKTIFQERPDHGMNVFGFGLIR